MGKSPANAECAHCQETGVLHLGVIPWVVTENLPRPHPATLCIGFMGEGARLRVGSEYVWVARPGWGWGRLLIAAELGGS